MSRVQGPPTTENRKESQKQGKCQEVHTSMQHSVGKLATMYKECRVSTKKLMAKLPCMRKEFLSTLLREDLGDDKEEKAMRIKKILQNEAQKEDMGNHPPPRDKQNLDYKPNKSRGPNERWYNKRVHH